MNKIMIAAALVAASGLALAASDQPGPTAIKDAAASVMNQLASSQQSSAGGRSYRCVKRGSERWARYVDYC